MRPEKKIQFTNSEHGILARLWNKFLKDHNLLPTLSARIVRTQNRVGLSKLTDKERKKLNTLRNLAYARELSFKTFLYLFKELIRGSTLTIALEFEDKDKETYSSSYQVKLQSTSEKDGGKVLGSVWEVFLNENKLYSELPTLIADVKSRDMSKLSIEQANKLKGIGKYAYAKDLTFKSLVYLFKELLNGDNLTVEITLRDAVGKDFTTSIKMKLNDFASADDDTNE